MQTFLEHSPYTQGMLAVFLFVKASAVCTQSLKRKSPSCEFPFLCPKVCFQWISCVGARLKCSDLCVRPPLLLSYWSVPCPLIMMMTMMSEQKAQSGFAGVQSGGGWGGLRLKRWHRKPSTRRGWLSLLILKDIHTVLTHKNAHAHFDIFITLCSYVLHQTTNCTEGLRHTQLDASGKSSRCTAQRRSWDVNRRSRDCVCCRDCHDVMVTRMPWHSLMQHNITIDPQADIRPCAPQQLPSHWLNKHPRRDFRELSKQLRCLTIGWSSILFLSY